QVLDAGDEVAATRGQLVMRLVVALLGGIDPRADLFQVGGKGDELVVELASRTGDLDSVALLVLMAPDVLDGAQGGQQRRRPYQHDVFLEGDGEHLRNVPARHRESGLYGHEQKHEIK